MHMVALIAVVGKFDILIRQVGGHCNGLYDFLGTGLDLGVVASQAQNRDIPLFFHRQSGEFLVVPDMIGIGTVAEFAGYGGMATGLVNLRLIGMAGKTGGVGGMLNGKGGLFRDGVGPVAAITAKGIRNKEPLEKKSGTGHDQNGHPHENKTEPIV
jgi:hypothetical protein